MKWSSEGLVKWASEHILYKLFQVKKREKKNFLHKGFTFPAAFIYNKHIAVLVIFIVLYIHPSPLLSYNCKFVPSSTSSSGNHTSDLFPMSLFVMKYS